jgi:hypothetical protein
MDIFVEMETDLHPLDRMRASDRLFRRRRWSMDVIVYTPAEVAEHQNYRNSVLRDIEAYRACRWGIERWAGRTFTNDEDIAQWWQRAQGKPQREWVEQSLTRTAAEADAGSAKAQYIIRRVGAGPATP